MALVFADGFDHYLGADILKKWTGFVTGTTISAANTLIGPDYTRPPGGMGLFCVDGNANRGWYKNFPNTYTTFVCGMHVYFTSTASTGPFLTFFDSSSGVPGSTKQIGLRLDGAGHIQVGRGSNAATILATSTNVLATNTWYHIEFKCTINNTTGVIEVRVNGSSTGWIPSTSGQNTRGQSSNNVIDTVALETGGGNLYRDDFYFLSSSSPNNDFLGPQKIITAFPAGAGNYAQWTGNYATNFANVQELGADSDSSFNQTSGAGNRDSYAFDDLPAGTIAAIQHTILARQDAGAARTIKAMQRSGSTDYDGTAQALGGGYLFYMDPKDVDPATSAAFTVSNFNAAEFGVKLES